MNNINEHLCQSMCLKCPPPTRTYLWWPCATGLSQCRWCPGPSQTKFASSVFTGHNSQVFNVMNLYFIHALLYNTRNK